MKYLRVLTTVLVLVMLPLIAQATSYSFTPYDKDGNKTDIFDLDHNYIYIWGIKPQPLPTNEVITSATISIKDITNWDKNWNLLKFYLVDNPRISDSTATTVDIISINDGSGTTASKELPYYETIGDYPNSYANRNKKFTDYVTLKTTYSDSNGVNAVDQFAYSFDTSEIGDLKQYLTTANLFTNKNANFGIGFDPDCHFYNNGITLTIVTSPVPEPTTMLLLGLGLIGLAGASRKIKK